MPSTGPETGVFGDFEQLPTVFDSRDRVVSTISGEAEWAVLGMANSGLPLQHRRPGIIVYAGHRHPEEAAEWCDETLVPAMSSAVVPMQIVQVGVCRPVLVPRDITRQRGAKAQAATSDIIAFNRQRYEHEVARVRDRAEHTRTHHSVEAVQRQEAEEEAEAPPPAPDRETGAVPARWETALTFHDRVHALVNAEAIPPVVLGAVQEFKKAALAATAAREAEGAALPQTKLRAPPGCLSHDFFTAYVLLSDVGDEALVGITGFHRTEREASSFIETELAPAIGGDTRHLVLATNRFIDLWELHQLSKTRETEVVDDRLRSMGIGAKSDAKGVAAAIDRGFEQHPWALDQTAAAVAQ